MAKIDPKKYPGLADAIIPCPFHLIGKNEEVECDVSITKNLTVQVQCPKCHSRTFMNGRDGWDIVDQMVKEYKEK